MNIEIKIKSKKAISKCTGKLFLISFASFLIRYLLILGNGVLFYYTIKNRPLFYMILPVIFSILSIFFISGIKSGEHYVYYSVSDNLYPRISLLFKYLSPKEAVKSAYLFIKLNFMKILWLLYFLTPAIILSGVYFYLYENVQISIIICACIIGGIAFLLMISLVFWRTAVLRYSASLYYFFSDSKRRVNRAIKKSILHTDGTLTDGAVFEYSFAGWILSCLFILPIFYVVPYIKTNKAFLIREITEKKYLSKERKPAIIFTAYKEAP